MNRRAILAAVAAVSGCTEFGYSSVGETPKSTEKTRTLSSEGNDDVRISASVDDLLLSSDDFESDAWTRHETNEEHCRKFSRQESNDASAVLIACAWLYDDRGEAVYEYESLVDRRSKFAEGTPTREDPAVGVDATTIPDGGGVFVIFRDANAVGSVEFRRRSSTRVEADRFPDPAVAITFAVRMHRQWRQ